MYSKTIQVNGSEYEEASNASVGQRFKDKNACDFYKSHSLSAELNAFLSEAKKQDIVDDVLASGDSCGSSPNHSYISYTNQDRGHLYKLTCAAVINNNTHNVLEELEDLATEIGLEFTEINDPDLPMFKVTEE